MFEQKYINVGGRIVRVGDQGQSTANAVLDAANKYYPPNKTTADSNLGGDLADKLQSANEAERKAALQRAESEYESTISKLNYIPVAGQVAYVYMKAWQSVITKFYEFIGPAILGNSNSDDDKKHLREMAEILKARNIIVAPPWVGASARTYGKELKLLVEATDTKGIDNRQDSWYYKELYSKSKFFSTPDFWTDDKQRRATLKLCTLIAKHKENKAVKDILAKIVDLYGNNQGFSSIIPVNPFGAAAHDFMFKLIATLLQLEGSKAKPAVLFSSAKSGWIKGESWIAKLASAAYANKYFQDFDAYVTSVYATGEAFLAAEKVSGITVSTPGKARLLSVQEQLAYNKSVQASKSSDMTVPLVVGGAGLLALLFFL